MPDKNRRPAYEASLIGNIQVGELKQARRAAKGIKSQLKGQSMAAMAQGNIMQFPIIMSSAIDSEDTMVVAKALERQYAVFALIVLGSTINIDDEKYDTLQDFLRDIHNNKNAPNLMDYAIGLTSNASQIGNAIAMASTTEYFVTDDLMNRLWYSPDVCATMESINEKYLPNAKNVEKLESVLHPANEADMDLDDLNDAFTAMANLDRGRDTAPGLLNIGGDKFAQSRDYQQARPRLYAPKSLAMDAPTLIDAKLYINNIPRVFTVGVKGMVRVVDSATMANELRKSTESSNMAFKFIKWTKGELKFFKDFVLGITQARKDAIAEKNGKGWFAAMRRRKQNARTFIGGGRPLSPINTIVCTQYEVDLVRQQTGVDLADPKFARKLMNELYLIGFVIVDTSAKTVRTMFDGDATGGDFAFSTLDSLKKHITANGNTTITDVTQFLKEIGR